MSTLQQLSRAALVYLFILLAGAVLFYRERMLLADAPWVLFNIINQKSFFIQEHRYGSFITQMVPLTGSLLYVPLKWLMIAYSVAFNLFYFLTAWILHRRGEYACSILLALYFSLCVSSSYFWTNNEVHQGIAWCMLLCGYWRTYERKEELAFRHYVVLLLLAFLAIFSHPIVIAAVLYILGFLLINRTTPWKRKHSIIVLLLLILMVSKYLSSKAGWYDEGKLSMLESASPQKLVDAWHSATARDFLQKCSSRYLPFSIITVFSSILLLTKRKLMLLFWMLGCMAAYMLAICVIYPHCDYSFYIESEWMSLALMPGLPLILLTTKRREMMLCTLLVGLSFCWSLTNIYRASGTFQNRVKILENTVNWLQQNDYHKVVALTENSDLQHPLEQYLIMDWGLPVELMLLNNLNNPHQETVTAVCITKNRFEETYAPLGPSYFFNSFYAEKISHLNAYYFRLDSLKPYQTIDVSRLMEVMQHTR